MRKVAKKRGKARKKGGKRGKSFFLTSSGTSRPAAIQLARKVLVLAAARRRSPDVCTSAPNSLAISLL